MSEFPTLLPTFSRADIAFSHGDGANLYAEDGTRYLDFGAGIAVNALGHAHPHLVRALTDQASKVWHVSNLYRIPEGEKLAKRLVDNTFADTVFFTNSGVEAIEASIKIARRYHFKKGHPERFHIITFEGAFHGRTLAGIAAGGQEKYLEGFGPKVQGFDQVPFGDLKALDAMIGPHTAALMIEPIQGEGGLRPADAEFLRALRKRCDEHDLLLILDEVQTGVGRTGKFFAHEWSGVTPDIMAIAKGIGGGFPLGACLCTAKAASGIEKGSHGTTFGGNPLAMAVGNAVLDVVLDKDFLPRVQKVANYAKQQLGSLIAEYPDVFEDVRGTGLMLGLKMKVTNTEFIDALRAHKMLAVGAGNNVIRLLPPLIITEEQVREAVKLLGETAATFQKKAAAE